VLVPLVVTVTVPVVVAAKPEGKEMITTPEPPAPPAAG
jgi:hypothetical protein